MFANSGEIFPPYVDYGIFILIVNHYSADEKLSHHRDDVSVLDCAAEDGHQLVMVYRVKELSKVNVYNPAVPIVHHL